MATIAERLQAEIDRANAATGKEDTTVHNAVGSLIEGYGQSTGGSDDGWIGDGNTHIWIHLEDGRTSPMLGCCPNGTVTVDWGDGTAPDTLTGEDINVVKWTPTHNYAKPGDYMITLIVDGEVKFKGDSSFTYILRYSASNDTRSYAYISAIKKVEIGTGITAIGDHTFANCYSLTSITISNSVSSIGDYAFQTCTSLTSVTIPESVASIGNNIFENCYSLTSITFPNGANRIGLFTFQNCYSLTSIIIPNRVKRIENSTFRYCYSMRYCDFTAFTIVPLLANQNAFYRIAEDCEIRVPAALYEEWKAATNWSTYADHIVAV